MARESHFEEMKKSRPSEMYAHETGELISDQMMMTTGIEDEYNGELLRFHLTSHVAFPHNIDEQSWFQPKTKKKEAELFLEHAPVGAFLIRIPANPFSYMLDVQAGPRIGHVLLAQIMRDEMMYVRLPGTPHVFQHLFDLVRFCHFNPFHFEKIGTGDSSSAINLSIVMSNRADVLYALQRRKSEINHGTTSQEEKEQLLQDLDLQGKTDEENFQRDLKVEIAMVKADETNYNLAVTGTRKLSNSSMEKSNSSSLLEKALSEQKKWQQTELDRLAAAKLKKESVLKLLEEKDMATKQARLERLEAQQRRQTDLDGGVTESQLHIVQGSEHDADGQDEDVWDAESGQFTKVTKVAMYNADGQDEHVWDAELGQFKKVAKHKQSVRRASGEIFESQAIPSTWDSQDSHKVFAPTFDPVGDAQRQLFLAKEAELAQQDLLRKKKKERDLEEQLEFQQKLADEIERKRLLAAEQSQKLKDVFKSRRSEAILEPKKTQKQILLEANTPKINFVISTKLEKQREERIQEAEILKQRVPLYKSLEAERQARTASLFDMSRFYGGNASNGKITASHYTPPTEQTIGQVSSQQSKPPKNLSKVKLVSKASPSISNESTDFKEAVEINTAAPKSKDNTAAKRLSSGSFLKNIAAAIRSKEPVLRGEQISSAQLEKKLIAQRRESKARRSSVDMAFTAAALTTDFERERLLEEKISNDLASEEPWGNKHFVPNAGGTAMQNIEEDAGSPDNLSTLMGLQASNPRLSSTVFSFQDIEEDQEYNGLLERVSKFITTLMGDQEPERSNREQDHMKQQLASIERIFVAEQARFAEMEKRTDEDVSNPLLSDIQRKNPKAYAELLTEQASMKTKRQLNADNIQNQLILASKKLMIAQDPVDLKNSTLIYMQGAVNDFKSVKEAEPTVTRRSLASESAVVSTELQGAENDFKSVKEAEHPAVTRRRLASESAVVSTELQGAENDFNSVKVAEHPAVTRLRLSVDAAARAALAEQNLMQPIDLLGSE